MRRCAIVPLTRPDDLDAATGPVAGVPSLVRVVRSVLHAVGAEHVVVATLPALAAGATECLRAAGLTTAVVVAREPASRYRVIRAGLEHLGAQPRTAVSVLICDHRYPLSPGEVADRVLAALDGGADVVVPVLPVTDSVKTVDDLGSVLSTVDRSTLRTVQFPRGFTASVLWQLVEVSPGPLDEFAAALGAGVDVGVVDGDADTFGVQLPRDARLLAAVIARHPD